MIEAGNVEPSEPSSDVHPNLGQQILLLIRLRVRIPACVGYLDNSAISKQDHLPFPYSDLQRILKCLVYDYAQACAKMSFEAKRFFCFLQAMVSCTGNVLERWKGRLATLSAQQSGIPLVGVVQYVCIDQILNSRIGGIAPWLWSSACQSAGQRLAERRRRNPTTRMENSHIGGSQAGCSRPHVTRSAFVFMLEKRRL